MKTNKQKAAIINEMLENIKRKYPKYFSIFKQDLEPIEKSSINGAITIY